MFKTALKSIVVMSALGFVLFWFLQYGAQDNTKMIEYIKAHTYNGKIVDSQNEISVRNGAKDIKWYYDEHDTLIIEYGKIKLKYSVKDFITPKVQKDLESIFITVKQHPKTFKLTLFFLGEELTEYVKK